MFGNAFKQCIGRSEYCSARATNKQLLVLPRALRAGNRWACGVEEQVVDRPLFLGGSAEHARLRWAFTILTSGDLRGIILASDLDYPLNPHCKHARDSSCWPSSCVDAMR